MVAKGDHLNRLAGVLSKVFRFTIVLAALAAIGSASFAAGKRSGRVARVQTGLDTLAAQKLAPLRAEHVGVITNHTGVDSQGKSTADRLSHALSVQLVAL